MAAIMMVVQCHVLTDKFNPDVVLRGIKATSSVFASLENFIEESGPSRFVTFPEYEFMESRNNLIVDRRTGNC